MFLNLRHSNSHSLWVPSPYLGCFRSFLDWNPCKLLKKWVHSKPW
ncbi:MAG: hypothetical protein EB053_04400 [Chlamydiae bacterium]|nr:hypothetical protein [Chlamydiota bacterium]